MQTITLPVTEQGTCRIDKFLVPALSEYSRTAVSRLCEQGNVLCNGTAVGKSFMISAGDTITVCLPDPVDNSVLPENIPLDIVYEDSDLLVVNKPKGMVVHPAAGNRNGTLVNALLYHCGDSLSGIGGVIRPGIVHRIDKETSGLLIVAKNDFSHRALAEQIKVHSFSREYRAIAVGNIKEDSGTINLPIGRHPVKRKQMAVTDRNSKPAVTHFEVLSRLSNGNTYLKLRLETGRTHQIRVHLSYMGHPLVGDVLYGAKKEEKDFSGQCLHAALIGFVHPRTQQYLEFTAPLPAYFSDYLKKFQPVK